MATDMLLDFYESINFELIDIDGYDTLFTELLEDGTYATVSDDDGHMPEDLETPIVFNVYDDNDSFQWSVTLDDSYQLKDLLDSAEGTDEFLETLQRIREEHIEQTYGPIQKKKRRSPPVHRFSFTIYQSLISQLPLQLALIPLAL